MEQFVCVGFRYAGRVGHYDPITPHPSPFKSIGHNGSDAEHVYRCIREGRIYIWRQDDLSKKGKYSRFSAIWL